MVDTNVLIDFLNVRKPYYESARLLMICGRLGEIELWVSSSQITDIIYVISNGARRQELPGPLEKVRNLRAFLKVCPIGPAEIDGMLASDWKDPEARLIYEAAIACNADAIITRDNEGYETDAIRVCDCEGFFKWLREDFGIDHSEIAF